MSINNKHIIIFSSSPWNGMLFQRQRFARAFAENGNLVTYIENIPLQPLSLQRIKRILRGKRTYLDTSLSIPKPKNLLVLKPMCLPPTILGSNIFNKIVINKVYKKIMNRGTPYILISYIAASPVLQLADQLNPRLFVYICVHFYKGLGVPVTVINAEIEIIKKASVVLTDSTYLYNYVQKFTKNKIYRALPGVEYAIFKDAYRGDEISKKRIIGYFGFIGTYIDISYFNKAVEDGYEVRIIGQIDNSLKNLIDKRIKRISTVLNTRLPDFLKEIDVLLIPLFVNDRTHGVIPAKLFECLATGKPVYITDIYEVQYYDSVVFRITSYNDFINKLCNLTSKEYLIKLKKQDEIAQQADWNQRFKTFESILENQLSKKDIRYNQI